MFYLMFFVGGILASVSATSPIKNETEDCIVPTNKPPVVSVPRKCPENEVLKSRRGCFSDTCDTLYVSNLCAADETEYLACTCKDNYLRTNATGVCIPSDRCLPPECANDPNAKRGCGNRCRKTCADYKDTSKVCKNNVCKLFGCECMDGFVYDDNVQKCVKPSQCTQQCKKPNERYTSCLLGECVAKTCDDLGKPIACPRVAPPCAGGCICAEGYVRNSKGDCIDKLKCPSCGGDPNAQSGCGNPCGKTCDSLGINKSELVCPQFCEVNGCDCKPGYVLDTDAKKCVPKESCPQLQCKKPNERYTSCLLGECVAKTCDDLGKPIACASIAPPCAGGCICVEGYVRNSKGDCIDKLKCPSCGGDPNAQSGCGNPCGKTCAGRGAKRSVACAQYCLDNGCDCKPGYLLDTDTKKCVPEKSCPKPPQCKGPHEVYNSCPLGQCGPKTCDNLINPAPCPRVIPPCPGGCICEEGYLRDSNGICIEMSKCAPQCKGPHEVYNSCPLGQCGPKTCDNLINPAPCPRVIPPCPGGCICEEGYLRDSNGICIERNKCPQLACNCNQTYVTCNINCPDKYCPENDQPQPVCDPPKNCPPGCSCKINYRLNKSGQCILASECPPINCTRQNEEYNSCPSDCLAENCEDADKPTPVCNTLLLNCQPKCVCKKNHYRNEDGLCVPVAECHTRTACKDPNAQWKSCKDPCPGTCQNTRPPCSSTDCVPGCQCKEGYVLSKLGGVCVNIDTCAGYADCVGNETFVPCTFKCPQNVCPESDQTYFCKPPRDCPGGCGCKPDYRYNYDGECILAKDCPPVVCTRPNEAWDPCRSDNNLELCEEIKIGIYIPTDTDICNPRCTCNEGYYRTNANECVLEKDCPP